ncbi:MAG TPA: DUF4010 domain-containing protein [Gammaproteobacteria bacterium]|nr:DUF4010 domain-containing protein [Gammaproteobacteria bacterium]
MPDTPLFAELLSQLWFRFLLVALFGFLTGLEMREYILFKGRESTDDTQFSLGSARTYTYIAVLGFVFYVLDPDFRLYLAGLGVLMMFFGLLYYKKLQGGQRGILQPLIALIVYTYGPSLSLLPPWFLVLLFVATVFILNARPLTHRLTETIDRRELMTLAKFLLLAAVILPLMPDQPVIPLLPTTPFKIWVAVVAVSAISYLGYILQRYLFPNKGYLVTGLLGGLYSSTATTIVLARRARTETGASAQLGLAIVAASGMMYLRLLVLIAILNSDFLPLTAAPFLLLGVGSILFALLRQRRHTTAAATHAETVSRNPLELGTAFLFAVLFLVMLLLSKGVLHQFGTSGLQVLSFVVGFTDIDPFVLSLLKGEYPSTTLQELAAAIVIAAGSNNFLKAVYAAVIGGWHRQRLAIVSLLVLGVLTLSYGLGMAL